MSTERQHVEMDCTTCGGTRLHEILYVGRLMVSVRCCTCGSELTTHNGHLVQDWLGDLSRRLAGKGHDLWSDARADSGLFVRTLPARLARQPVKLVDEVATVLSRRGRKGD